MNTYVFQIFIFPGHVSTPYYTSDLYQDEIFQQPSKLLLFSEHTTYTLIPPSGHILGNSSLSKHKQTIQSQNTETLFK